MDDVVGFPHPTSTAEQGYIEKVASVLFRTPTATDLVCTALFIFQGNEHYTLGRPRHLPHEDEIGDRETASVSPYSDLHGKKPRRACSTGSCVPPRIQIQYVYRFYGRKVVRHLPASKFRAGWITLIALGASVRALPII
jgi:hypothetical protein